MNGLNVAHASELVLLASLVGAMAMYFWKKCPFPKLSRLVLAYAVSSFAVAAVLLFLILMEQGGMGGTVAPLVEALSYIEADLS